MNVDEALLKRPKRGLERTFRYLASTSTWSLGLFGFFFVILSMISLLTDVVSVGAFTALWFLVSGAGFLPPLIIGFAYRWLFLNKKSRVSITLNLSVAAIAGASRNVSVGLFADWAGLAEGNLWSFRFFGGAFMGVAIFALWSMANGSKFEYSAALDELSTTQRKLAATRLEMPEQLVEINEGLQERTRQAIFPQIQNIKELLAGSDNLTAVLEKLKFAIGSQIRPMMEEIEASQPKPFEVRNLKRLSTVKSPLPDRFVLRDKINLGWSSFLETLGVSLWLWVYSAPNGVWDNLALFVLYLSVLTLFKYLVPKEKKVPKYNAIFFTFLAAASASSANVVYIFLVLGFDVGKSIMFAGFALLSGILGPMLLMHLAVRSERRAEIEAQVAGDLRKIAKENALFAQKLWVFRKRWLLVLHGSVQSALTAALSRLQNSKELSPVLVELVKQDLSRAEVAVNSDLSENLVLTEGLIELQEVWSGICNVQFQVSSRAQRAIERNPDSAFCVNEIAKEAISNAVRHGEATEATVFIDRTEDDILRVEITNNGNPPETGRSKGIGSEMLDEVCISWNLHFNKKQVRLSAELPVKLYEVYLPPLASNSA